MPSRRGPTRAPLEALAGREVIVEVTQNGSVIVAAAVDAATGAEASAQGPAHAQIADIERLALGKLARRLEALGVLTGVANTRARADDDADPDERGLRI